MQLINRTHIPNTLVIAIIKDLGLASHDIILKLEVGDYPFNGRLRRDNTTYLISIDTQASISTLAHELKHVEQHVNGLTEWIQADKQVSQYKDQWHELEAYEYGMVWESKFVA